MGCWEWNKFERNIVAKGQCKEQDSKRHKMTIDFKFNMFIIAVCDNVTGREW